MALLRSLTPTVYSRVGNLFRDRFGQQAGWAHSLLFAAELPGFKVSLRLVVLTHLSLQYPFQLTYVVITGGICKAVHYGTLVHRDCEMIRLIPRCVAFPLSPHNKTTAFIAGYAFSGDATRDG